MTNTVNISMTLSEADELQHAIAARRSQCREFRDMADANGRPNTAAEYVKEDAVLRDIMLRIARASAEYAKRMSARTEQDSDTPAFMHGYPIELD